MYTSNSRKRLKASRREGDRSLTKKPKSWGEEDTLYKDYPTHPAGAGVAAANRGANANKGS